MPCICWYNPPEEYKRVIKNYCESIIKELKHQETHGDLESFDLNDIKKLLDHLYTEQCDEKPTNTDA